MPGAGHVQRLLPLIRGLSTCGRTVHVLTHARFRATVERVGGQFFDLFGRYPVEAVDATSIPIPSRFVTYADAYAERLTEDVAALTPGLIIYDTFAVIAPLIAQRLGLPYVNVCAGHAAVPARTIAELQQDPRVAISPACWAAVRRLQDVHGMRGAHPFSYVEMQSPFLNLYCEPSEFLPEEDRATFEPIAFFGSLAPELREEGPVEIFPRTPRSLRIYVAFGTLIWRYFATAASAALEVVSRICTESDMDVVIGLGGHERALVGRASLLRPNVQVFDYADQWAALRQADIYVTHHGLNSTHESIFHQVPMISYPFFGDQPAQARCCQDLGLAVPLVSTPRTPIEPDTLRGAIQQITDNRPAFAARLAAARAWELRTIADRGAIIDRVVALAS